MLRFEPLCVMVTVGTETETVAYPTTSMLLPLSLIDLLPLASSLAVTVTAVPVFVEPLM